MVHIVELQQQLITYVFEGSAASLEIGFPWWLMSATLPTLIGKWFSIALEALPSYACLARAHKLVRNSSGSRARSALFVLRQESRDWLHRLFLVEVVASLSFGRTFSSHQKSKKFKVPHRLTRSLLFFLFFSFLSEYILCYSTGY